MGEGPAREKSYAFALNVVKEVKCLRGHMREFELTGQLVRAATSIGANIEEANAGQSKRDFAAKMAIASKEARKSHYWLRLLRDSGYLAPDNVQRLLAGCEELIKLTTAIVRTTQRNISAKN